MRCVLLLASGAAWETAALEVLDRASGVVVLKRCVDLDDLLASATTGQAEYAVVAAETTGFDAAALGHLAHSGVRPVVVLSAGAGEQAEHRLAMIGASTVVDADAVGSLPQVLSEAATGPGGSELSRPATPISTGPVGADPAADGPPVAPGRVIAVWGPVGAPGRTTVAVALAGELSARGRAALLVDADPHAAVAQHLGVLDQVSGLLAAARVARTGDLVERLPTLCRGVVDDLAVLSGVPRADRGTEVEPGVLAEVVEASRKLGDVVVDCGWELADDQVGFPREASGLLAGDLLLRADEVVVVGAADPVGLARLARALVEMGEHVGDRPVHVVVNRMRSTLGWSRAEVLGMVEGFATTASVHLLPDDRVAVDRALVSGRPVTHAPGSPLADALVALLDAVHPAAGPGARSRTGVRAWVRQRRAGTAHRP